MFHVGFDFPSQSTVQLACTVLFSNTPNPPDASPIAHHVNLRKPRIGVGSWGAEVGGTWWLVARRPIEPTSQAFFSRCYLAHPAGCMFQLGMEDKSAPSKAREQTCAGPISGSEWCVATCISRDRGWRGLLFTSAGFVCSSAAKAKGFVSLGRSP